MKVITTVDLGRQDTYCVVTGPAPAKVRARIRALSGTVDALARNGRIYFVRILKTYLLEDIACGARDARGPSEKLSCK